MRPQIFRGHPLHARNGAARLCVAAALLVLCAWPAPRRAVNTDTPAATVTGETVSPSPRGAGVEEIDAALRHAADAALGGREGTIVVADAQTGRVRAAANLALASGAALPPGSAIKPFTLLAALRSRIVAPRSRLACRKHFARPGVDFTCAHPVFKPPFDAEHALAHSCNYYFARLGERVAADDFNATLSAFGFGPPLRTSQQRHSQTTPAPARPRTRAAAHHAAPAAPRLPRSPLRTETALGEGDGLLVTPLQLLAAYTALFNGGLLFDPREAPPAEFDARAISRVRVSDEERALLVAGMRGAVKYGTAEAARLGDLPLRVFGKTGTATEIGGFRTDGWFVGLASDPNAQSGDQPAPSEIKLAVLVFLKHSQGRQAAAAARGIFAEYARLTGGNGGGNNARTQTGFSEQGAGGFSQSHGEISPSPSRPAGFVRVRASRDSAPVALPVEEYLFGALAAEASTEDEFAALKAQAVVSRTYALRHAGRHAREGYDFCSTTHCQRYLRLTPADSRPDFHALLRRALSETAGETLRDARGRTAAAYFSASCGGMTADVETLWGTPAREPYERGVRDEACSAVPPHARWTDVIPAHKLLLALRADPRTDVGSRLANVSVVKRDRTGRAELVAVDGDRRKLLRGWDFKIIVGRTLGWSVIKSSRFAVGRAGGSFVFRGSGFGHGLGLCQQGAHVLARRGASHRQILAHYFPGTTVARDTSSARREPSDPTHETDSAWAADATAPLNATAREVLPRPRTNLRSAALSSNTRAAPPRLTLASANFRVHYTANDARARREVEAALRTLESARADLLRRISAASLPPPALPAVEIIAHETTADFVAATGQPAWVAAATRGSRVELQPLATLRRRRLTERTLRHEFAHVAVSALSRGRAPRWLAEGLAAHFAGEGLQLSRHAAPRKLSLPELEAALARPAAPDETRALYAAAYREVAALVRAGGEAAVWRLAARG